MIFCPACGDYPGFKLRSYQPCRCARTLFRFRRDGSWMGVMFAAGRCHPAWKGSPPERLAMDLTADGDRRPEIAGAGARYGEHGSMETHRIEPGDVDGLFERILRAALVSYVMEE